MSNCNWEHLRGFEERVLVGAEVVNGTGEVRCRFYDDEATSQRHETVTEMVFLTMTPDQALDFARLLSRQAHEAMRAKWDEESILSG